MEASKPSMDCNRPIAVITPPPGTPGAATIITPSTRIMGIRLPKSGCWPVMNSTATEQEVMVIMEPER